MTPTPQDSQVVLLIAVICLGLTAFSKAQPAMVRGEAPPSVLEEPERQAEFGGSSQPRAGLPLTSGTGGGVTTPPVTLPPSAPAPIPASEWTPATQLDAARTCWGEGGFNLRDCASVLWVVTNRYRQGARPTWVQTLKAYSAIWGRRSPRQRLATSLPWSDYPGWNARLNASWAVLRAHVLRWGEGKVRNPCARAVHFGGAMDAAPSGHVRVRCIGVANRFYRRAE